MSDKDYIKEEFQNRFADFEAEVDPKIWNSIQSNISAPPTPKASFLNISTLSIVASVSVLSVIGYFVVENQDVPVPSKKIEVSESIKDDNLIDLKVTNTQDVPSTPINDNDKHELIKETKVNLKSSKPAKSKEKKNTILPSTKSESKNIADNNTEHKIVAENVNKINTQEIISKTPKSINVSEQSKVIASPMGGNAPLSVEFSSLSNAKEIKWIFDDGAESNEISPVHIYEEPGVYFVTMLVQLENGSVVMDKAVIEVSEEKSIANELPIESVKIGVPNIFTPNSDGENDKLTLSVTGVSSFTISIYSASGKMVYTSESFIDQWDGTNLNGERVEDGAYYYLINAIGMDGNVYAPKGFISLRTK